MATIGASHRCAAEATSVSSTGCRSNFERLMAPSTSLVAVCCSSDSVSSAVRACTSSNSRVFSMAITAWSAKVVHELNLLVAERLHDLANQRDDADLGAFAQQGHAETVRKLPRLCSSWRANSGSARTSGICTNLAFQQDPPNDASAVGRDLAFPHEVGKARARMPQLAR